MPGDALGVRLQAGISQFLADPREQVDHLGRQGAREVLGAPGARLERTEHLWSGLRLCCWAELDPLTAEASTGTAVVLTLGHPVAARGPRA